MERDTSLNTKILTVLNGSIYITPALTNLEEDTHYEISVRANTSVGAGPWTNLTVHTPEDGEINFNFKFYNLTMMNFLLAPSMNII